MDNRGNNQDKLNNKMEIDKNSINMSIVAYILPIGWIYSFIATAMYNGRNGFTVFHLRQAFGLNLIIISFWLLLKIVNLSYFREIIWVLLILNIIYGIAGAYSGRRLYQVFLGKKYDTMFTFIS